MGCGCSTDAPVATRYFECRDSKAQEEQHPQPQTLPSKAEDTPNPATACLLCAAVERVRKEHYSCASSHSKKNTIIEKLAAAALTEIAFDLCGPPASYFEGDGILRNQSFSDSRNHQAAAAVTVSPGSCLLLAGCSPGNSFLDATWGSATSRSIACATFNSSVPITPRSCLAEASESDDASFQGKVVTNTVPPGGEEGEGEGATLLPLRRVVKGEGSPIRVVTAAQADDEFDFGSPERVELRKKLGPAGWWKGKGGNKTVGFLSEDGPDEFATDQRRSTEELQIIVARRQTLEGEVMEEPGPLYASLRRGVQQLKAKVACAFHAEAAENEARAIDKARLSQRMAKWRATAGTVPQGGVCVRCAIDQTYGRAGALCGACLSSGLPPCTCGGDGSCSTPWLASSSKGTQSSQSIPEPSSVGLSSPALAWATSEAAN